MKQEKFVLTPLPEKQGLKLKISWFWSWWFVSVLTPLPEKQGLKRD